MLGSDQSNKSDEQRSVNGHCRSNGIAKLYFIKSNRQTKHKIKYLTKVMNKDQSTVIADQTAEPNCGLMFTFPTCSV